MTSKRELLIRIGKYLIAVMLLVLVLGSLFITHKRAVDSRRVLSEAKNVQLTMRLLTIEYNAHNRSIYQSGTQYGMSDATAAEVAFMSDTLGETILLSWNYTNQKPEKFLYVNDGYMVVYQYMPDSGQDTWKVYELSELENLGK